MRKKSTNIFLFGSFILICIFVTGNIKAQKQDFPVSLSVINQSWAFPQKKVFRMKPFYPGLVFGTEYSYKEGKRGRLLQSANFGFFINNVTGSCLFLHSDFVYRYTFNFGLFADVSLGLGYVHAFYPREIFRQNDENEYVKVRDTGKPAIMVSNSFSLGYDFSRKMNKPIALYLRYQWFAQYPYFELIPIRPNGVLHVGLRYYWKTID